jgi:1-acyl-sn-glycerol-3-phosphate acyltransferase
LVDRNSDRSRRKSFDAMKNVLAKGMHMCIYPEGTRNRSNEPIKQFYDGAFKLAMATKKEIMPCVISGTKKAMPINKKFFLLPVQLKMQFLPPESTTGKTVNELKEKVHAEMVKIYVGEVSGLEVCGSGFEK